MARVTLTFEDAVGGPDDGAAAGCTIDAEPGLLLYADGRPHEDMTTAQKMALYAIGCLSEGFDIGECTSDIKRVS